MKKKKLYILIAVLTSITFFIIGSLYIKSENLKLNNENLLLSNKYQEYKNDSEKEFNKLNSDLFNKEEEIQKLNYELNSLNDKLKKLQSQLTNSEADDKLNEEIGNILLEKEILLNEIHSLTTEIIDINSEKNTYLNQLENLFIETNILNKEKIELQQALYSIEDDFKNIIDGITNEINSVNNLGEPLTKEEIIKLLNY